MKELLVYLIVACFIYTAPGQDTAISSGPASVWSRTFIYKKDTLNFQKPVLLRSIGFVPTDIWQIVRSPLQKSNWKALGFVTLSSVALIAYDDDILKWVRRTSDHVGLKPDTDFRIAWKVGKTKIIKVPRNVNTLLYQLGEGGTSMILAGGLWIYGKIGKDTRAANTAYDLAETFLSMGITSQILKRITGRESPFMATAPGGIWRPFPSFGEFQRNTSAYDAFPSGHLATLMATVTVLASNYPEKKWIRPVGYTLMCLSSWAMMNTEVHWAGDYPLAIAIGYMSGKITALRNHRKNKLPVKTIYL